MKLAITHARNAAVGFLAALLACTGSSAEKPAQTIVLGVAHEVPVRSTGEGPDRFATELTVVHVLAGDPQIAGRRFSEVSAWGRFLPYPNLVEGHEYLVILRGMAAGDAELVCDTSISALEYAALSGTAKASPDPKLDALDSWKSVCCRSNLDRADLERGLRALMRVLKEERPPLAECYARLGQPVRRIRSEHSSEHFFISGLVDVDGHAVCYQVRLTFGDDLRLLRFSVVPLEPHPVDGRPGFRSVSADFAKSAGLLWLNENLEKDMDDAP